MNTNSNFRMEEARKRVQGRPPPTTSSIITGEESEAEIRQTEIVNGWIREWSKDRQLLTEAIKEIDRLQVDLELLRKSSASELLAQLKKIHEARNTVIAEEQNLAVLLYDLERRGLP